MGHAFQQTLMDALIRYHRMRGFNTNWVVGTDHAGIATQIVVERQLEAEGKTRHDLGRERSSSACGNGSSSPARPSRARCAGWAPPPTGTTPTPKASAAGYFTMDARMSRAVVEVFVRLHEGLIYRGKRLVNWDPVLGTAVSDLEVDSEEEDGKIWEIRYPLEDGSGEVVVATTRPETMLGDVAVAVQSRGRALSASGRQASAAAADRPHDSGHRRRLRRSRIRHRLRQDHAGARFQRLPGRPAPSAAADQHLDAGCEDQRQRAGAYRGLDRFEARKRVLADLQAQGLLVSEKPYKLRVPRSGRTGVIVEPMLTDQWFVKMDGLAKAGLEAVANGRSEVLPRALDDDLQPVAGEHPGLVHLAPAVVGPPDSGLVRRQGNIYVARSEAEAQKTGRGQRVMPAR